MQISFQRALPIYSDTDNKKLNLRDLDPATESIINTIEKPKDSYLDKETSLKVGKFLKAQLGDYNKKSGIYTTRIDGIMYLYSGEDALKAKKADYDTFKKIDNLENEYFARGESAAGDDNYYKQRDSFINERDEYLTSLIERKKDGTPKAYLELNKDHLGQINRVCCHQNGTYEEVII